ncbi:sulfur carrier protein ThiS [Pedobacter alluvionis]|uniref:Sulfur carrier protein ThiS n=1 Tax=Pedobacter alluvionis TaxID=475253 RepID=A0A497XXV7_9SPHI|nr:sulfur carrier protein ThiS [Pedobacter alluvionis]RLJ73718.1 sulfur carrier protein ThiS [Pedobacter alluvionis]TFB32662.1 sulfur carrier protein ThiS [Pedobacter alluvionis]
MEVTINNQNYQLNEACSIEQMLATVISTETNGLAIAVNQTIISKSDWDRHVLNPGDQIIIIKATQGG